MKPEFEEILSSPTISVPDAGRVLGLARNGAYDAAKRGDIPTMRIGHKIRVPTALLKKMIE
jgi:hypothetical protein